MYQQLRWIFYSRVFKLYIFCRGLIEGEYLYEGTDFQYAISIKLLLYIYSIIYSLLSVYYESSNIGYYLFPRSLLLAIIIHRWSIEVMSLLSNLLLVTLQRYIFTCDDVIIHCFINSPTDYSIWEYYMVWLLMLLLFVGDYIFTHYQYWYYLYIVVILLGLHSLSTQSLFIIIPTLLSNIHHHSSIIIISYYLLIFFDCWVYSFSFY